jgi:predicted Zn-dependent protease with MMP-like domain
MADDDTTEGKGKDGDIPTLQPDIGSQGGVSPEPQADQQQLDVVWLSLEEGRIEDAIEAVEELCAAFPKDGNCRLASAAVHYECGLIQESLDDATLAGELGAEDTLLQRWYIAASLHYSWRFEEARQMLDEILRDEDGFGEAWYLLAQVCEMQHDEIGARRGFERAVQSAPERFFRPTRFDEEQMDAALAHARNGLESEFQAALDELTIIVENVPNWELAEGETEHEEALPPDLLGLFVGNSRGEGSVLDPAPAPGIIYLFKKNLERSCGDGESLAEEVRTTLYHELAHYLGFEEEDMAELDLE